MSLDLVTEGRLVDIVAEVFDAGFRLGEAVPGHGLGPVRRGNQVPGRGIPDYLTRREVPRTPDDLNTMPASASAFRAASPSIGSSPSMARN